VSGRGSTLATALPPYLRGLARVENEDSIAKFFDGP
jgi:hypothetical protein